MVGEMLKAMWSDFDWKAKAFFIALPFVLLYFGTVEFAARPDCEYQREQLALVDRPDNYYRQSQVHNRTMFLRDCLQQAAVNKQAAARKKVDPYHVAQVNGATSGYSSFWAWWLLFVLPLGCLLSYAHAAGRWGNAAYVKWTDFYGIPLACFLSVGVFVHATVAVTLMQSGATLSQGTIAFFIGSIIVAFVFGIALSFHFTIEFMRELWTTLKGLAMLVHYMFTSHPAELHLPSHPEVAISRPALRDALTDRYTQGATGGGVLALMKPRFMYEHELLRANKVEELLRADTSILQEAIRRERARAEVADLKRA
jgi:hypothetical protein